MADDTEGHWGSPWRGASGSSRGTAQRGRGRRLAVAISSGLGDGCRPCGEEQSGEGAKHHEDGECSGEKSWGTSQAEGREQIWSVVDGASGHRGETAGGARPRPPAVWVRA
jgi:hypothetical protein